MIHLINVEEPLRNALEIIGWYCKHNDCKTCGLKINDDTCLTDKDPDVWWMYLKTDRKTENNCKDEPQTDNGIGCSRCEGRFDCYDRDMPHAVRCNNYGKITDEQQTERESE